MAVKIDIELQAGDAEAEILGIASALETLDTAASDFDLDFDDIDFDNINGEVGNLVSQLEDIDFLDDFDRKMSRIEDINDMEFNVKKTHTSPDGGTGSGDSTGADPPGDAGASADGGSGRAGLSEKQLAQKIERVGGFDRGSVKVLGDFDSEELNRIASDIEHTTKGLTSDKYPWLSGNAGDGNLGASQMPGNFHDKEDLSEMAWPKLQKRAREAGVYPQNADRETLEANLRSQQFGGKGIRVKTDSHGTVGLRQARRIKQGAYDFPDDDGGSGSYDVDRRKFLQHARDRSKIPDIDMRMADKNPAAAFSNREILKNTRLGKRISKMESLSDVMEGLGDAKGGLGSRLRRFKPTMGKYMQLLAALIPIAVGLGTQLLGVAAAMGSVAVAGGAIMGLGLIGHGESLAGSMAQAKQQIQALKKEMFNVAQPLAQQFAPMQARMFDAMPEGLGGMFEEMEGLTAFEDTLFNLGSALAGGMERFFAIINENEGAISRLSTNIGGLIGSGLLNFFEWLIQTASENEKLIRDLGGALMSLIAIGYNIAMVISRIIATFKPFFAILSEITSVLNNRFIVGLLTAITVAISLGVIFSKVTLAAYGLGAAIYQLVTFLSVLGSGSLLAGIGVLFSELLIYIEAAIGHFLALESTALQAAAAIAATGIGALVVGGGIVAGGAALSAMETAGPGGGAGGVSGGKTVYNDNRSYEISGGNMDDYATRKGVQKDIARNDETTEAQSLPPVKTRSESSNGS